MPPIVLIKDLVKTYPSGTRALDGITLDIQPGEFLVLIGLSGSGKSTLLRCINRLIAPSSGTVVFEGADGTAARGPELRRIRRRSGVIFRHVNLARRYGTRVVALKGGRVAFDGKPAEIDERRFKEIYGEDAIEVEIGPERSQPQPMSATEAALRAMADDTGHGAPPEIRPDG